MKNQIAVFAIATSLFFTACQNSPKSDSNKQRANERTGTPAKVELTDIAFNVAKNYFIKNTVTNLEDPKIETLEKFNELFGMATTMGKDGKPTEIDFTKQYVIAVVLPETDLQTTIDPVSLQRNEKGEITLSYRIVVGQKRTFTILPNLAIIVSKTDNGNLILKEQK